MEEDIYSAIFNLTKSNIEKANGEFTVSKEAFIELSRMAPREVDVFSLSREKDNMLFLEKAYICILKRLADKRAFEIWQDKFSLPYEEFQRLLINTILSSPEFAEKNVKVYNNIYSPYNNYHGRISNSSRPTGINRVELKLKMYSLLRKAYSKFPDRIKIILRKILLKKG